MGKGIYTYYKERLVEIGGNNKCLFLRSVVRKNAYDIGRVFAGREDKVEELIDFLWNGHGRGRLTLLCPDEAKEIAENVSAGYSRAIEEHEQNGVDSKRIAEDAESAAAKILEGEVGKVTELRREIEDVERETGRYELYIGYPFVFGSINQGSGTTMIKAPLLLFPVKIDIFENTVEIRFNESEHIQLNRALIYAYAQAKRLSVEGLEMEFDDLSGFKNVQSVLNKLAEYKIKIDCQASRHVHVYGYDKFKAPESKGELSVRHGVVMARFPISNSIYSDYCLLEKKNLTNDAINELLRTSAKGSRRKEKALKKKLTKERLKRLKQAQRATVHRRYNVRMLDYSQSKVLSRVDECGNMVIYGPPGTGKSQTIVNIITDAICKNKRVLVVSQKKAALDVVYSRLGTLSDKAMYVTDENKQKKRFYERCFAAHQRDEVESLVNVGELQAEYDAIEAKISTDVAMLEKIYALLNDKRPFGLSLTEMYSSSYMISKNSSEYPIYQNMLEEKRVISLGYKELSEALFTIQAQNLGKMYYDFVVAKEKNPLIDTMKPELDIAMLSEVKGQLEETQRSRRGPFNITKYPYTRQVLAHYNALEDERSFEEVIRLECRLESGSRRVSSKAMGAMRERFTETMIAIEEFTKDFTFLNKVMTRDGYLSVIDNILRGNNSYLKLVHDALDNYISMRDVSQLLGSLDENILAVLSFAYSSAKSYSNYQDIISKILLLRIYHEVITYEERCKVELSNILDYPTIVARITKNREEQLTVANKLCAGKTSTAYRTLFDNSDNGKDFLHQIVKEQKFWPIRKTMEEYGEFILTLFPCWLLSPENVSALLPLQKNMFDVVIFDEASQVFIESTIPTIYRGKNIVVAGDSKQLRPSATFMKRYMGADPDSQDDVAVQAALEVESLLDLAVSRYDSTNLSYHYRSRNRELIDFSNCAFYGSGLQIAPNISANKKDPPIRRIKVDGKWINRTNPTEAERVVELLREVLTTRKNNETVGIITFNSDQQSCIADAIDEESKRDGDFRALMTAERYRTEDGEDCSLFIKNLENVQGDERDIIIFSIGYAPGESGRIHSNFGSLSTEGGENRLNVAITRAKSRVYVVTSIEPEELKVDDSKNKGPKLLREYLAYVRAVSDGDEAQTAAILQGLSPVEPTPAPLVASVEQTVEEQIKARLQKAGYTVHTCLGNRNNRISLAIYDEDSDKYLVGVELDSDAFASSDSALERDVYKPGFLEGRGWTVLRVWCRDWWLSPTKVIKQITSIAEKNRK